MNEAEQLLRRALEYFDDVYGKGGSFFADEIRTYLANQETAKDEAVAIIEEADYGCWGQILPDKSVRLGQFLYLHPAKPDRKPIDGDQMIEGFALAQDLNTDYRLSSFSAGVRFAEKHHGITGEE